MQMYKLLKSSRHAVVTHYYILSVWTHIVRRGGVQKNCLCVVPPCVDPLVKLTSSTLVHVYVTQPSSRTHAVKRPELKTGSAV